MYALFCYSKRLNTTNKYLNAQQLFETFSNVPDEFYNRSAKMFVKLLLDFQTIINSNKLKGIVG